LVLDCRLLGHFGGACPMVGQAEQRLEIRKSPPAIAARQLPKSPGNAGIEAVRRQRLSSLGCKSKLVVITINGDHAFDRRRLGIDHNRREWSSIAVVALNQMQD